MPVPPTDKIFQVDRIEEDFAFNERVVEVFDDMLDRSIPFYEEVIQSSARLLASFLEEGEQVVDLGCSTGTTLLALARKLPGKNLHFIGVDNSPAMLQKARLKTELFSQQDHITFVETDVADLTCKDVGAFILNYTLQFVRPMQRPCFIEQLHARLRPGGILILSEKHISHDPSLNRKFIDIYHRFKGERGYSELEIAKKREALENILIPFSIEENRELLLKSGFRSIETFFQWFNFASFIAVKES